VNDEAGELERLVGEQAEPRAREGDMAYVRELGARMARGLVAAEQQVSSYRRGLARIVRTLALTPGRESVTQLLGLLDDHGPLGPSGTDPRTVASFLAEAQRPGDLAELLYARTERDALDELRDCVFHELLLRGVDPQDHEPLRSWPLGRPGWHPLTWLPADLRPFEADSPFPSRGINNSAGGAWTGLTDRGRLDPPTPRTAPPSHLVNTAGVELHELILSAPSSGEFGHCDAWVFTLDAPLDPAAVPALLPTLPMACVEGLGPTARFEIAERPLADVWKILFSTASMGGMYSHGVHGAYGRRMTWFSLAGLTGAPAGATAEEVERHALQSTWFHFECDTEWFHNEIHDYGMATLSPDRRRLAVLAATDTD
jgi:hypothetical protein